MEPRRKLVEELAERGLDLSVFKTINVGESINV